VAVVVLVLCTGATAGAALLGYLAALATVLVTTLWRLRSRALARPGWDHRLMRPLVTYGLRSQAGTLALILAYRSDLFMAEHALGASATGVYSVALTLSEVLRGVPETGQALVVSHATREGLTAYAESAARRTALATATAGAVLAAASHLLVPVVFGAPYRGASAAFACLVPGVVGLAVSYTVSPLLFLHGQVMVSAGAALASLVTLWILGLYGPGSMSLAKIATASSVAYWVLAVIQIAYLRKQGRLRVEKLVPGRDDVTELMRAVTSLPARLTSR
jgi:O-antigen/teichoic acid export membrane protein